MKCVGYWIDSFKIQVKEGEARVEELEEDEDG